MPSAACRAVAAVLLVLGMPFSLAVPARAAVFVTDWNGGTLWDGFLGQQQFTATPVTFTMTGDTTALTAVGVSLALPVTATIQVGALPTATPLAPFFVTHGVESSDLGFVNNPASSTQGIIVSAPELSGYNFTPIGPLSVDLLAVLGPIETDQGLLTFDSDNLPARLVVRVTEVGATPEPATFALLAAGLFGLGLLRRRG